LHSTAARTAPNIRQLIEKDKVLAIIGNVGTPTAIIAVPLANEEKTLLFAGGAVLRNVHRIATSSISDLVMQRRPEQ
jgi:ABC-type branched-subunit amino acid transport system substrate-binding protein